MVGYDEALWCRCAVRPRRTGREPKGAKPRRRRNERAELILTTSADSMSETALLSGATHTGTDGNESPGTPWHVLWTRSHCEQFVYEQLIAKAFHPFLPTIEVWSRRGGLRHRIHIPMFPGYLFLHDALDNYSDVEVRKARGLVSILGARCDQR